MPHQGHIFNQIRAKKLKERKGKMDGGLLFSPMRGMTCQCVCGISLRHDSNYVRHIIARVFPNVYMCKSTHAHILIPQNTSVKPLQFCNVCYLLQCIFHSRMEVHLQEQNWIMLMYGRTHFISVSLEHPHLSHTHVAGSEPPRVQRL